MARIAPVPPGDSSSDGTGEPALAKLLCRSAGGDEAAFTLLYDEMARRVYGLVLRVVRNPAQAEEVTQEVFLEIWRTAGKFDPTRGGGASWMLTITHRRAVDRVRSVEAATRRDTTYQDAAAQVPHDTTAETATASLEAKRVRQALTVLTAVQRQAIELAYFGGYTHTEVATMLGLPLGTAKTRIRDGLIRLRDQIGVAI